jgi:DNA-binding NtrC family response regulator
LVQFAREKCRRCGRALILPPERAQVPSLEIDPARPFPTLAEMEIKLIRAAVKYAGSIVLAAQWLGCGKTTLYAKIREARQHDASLRA